MGTDEHREKFGEKMKNSLFGLHFVIKMPVYQ
jgi:hypothetical protein